jgi:hypothetical protein
VGFFVSARCDHPQRPYLAVANLDLKAKDIGIDRSTWREQPVILFFS